MEAQTKAHTISRKIHGIEDQLDQLLAEAGDLLAEMANYRVETNMDANLGQRALARVAELQVRIVDARMKAIGAHSDLKKIIETTADFPFTCPDFAMAPSAKPDLRLAG